MTSRWSQILSSIGVGLAVALSASPSHAQDPAIERLLKKLPPPEKLVKPSVKKALDRPDPILKDPLARELLNNLARGNIAAGLVLVRKLAAKFPASASAHELHGLVAYIGRQFPEAAAALRRSIAIQPRRSSSHLGLVVVELAQRKLGAALPHARQVTEMEPGWAEGWLLLSGCEEDAGHNEKSAAAARRATVLAPAMLAAWEQLARAENRLGHASESLRALSKATEIAPDNAGLQATVGFGYINVNRSAEAVRPLSRAAQLAPKDYLIESQLGFALYVSGQTGPAIDHLRRGASLKPGYGPVWEHLGLAYRKAGRHREALEAFEKAARLMPDNRAARAHLAEEQNANGQRVRR